MLPRNYRVSAYNDSGASVDVTVTARRWKLDSNGAVVYESSEATLLSVTGVADTTRATGTAQDNTTDGWIGFDGIAKVDGGSSGVVTILLEASTDGGTSWPTAQGGIPIGAAVPSEDRDIVVIA